MATGGTSKIEKGYAGQKISVKRFAYDLLYITLSKCGFPKTDLNAKVDKANEYRHPNYVIYVHYAVVSIALGMRDKWRHMFEYKQKSHVLNDMQKVEKYLVNIEVLPEFRTDELNKIRRSLAFYSELMLFLRHNNLEVDFQKLLDIWTNYFNEKIAVKYDSGTLFEAIFIENDGILHDLSMVDEFIEEVAIPYGKDDFVSEKFKDFNATIVQSYEDEMIRLQELVRGFREVLLGDPPQYVFEPLSEYAKKSVSFSPEIPEKASDLSDTRTAHGPPGLQRDFPVPSTSEKGMGITDDTPQERKDGDTVSLGHLKPNEPPREMAIEEKRIQKSYNFPKLSVKWFAYDVLHMTLSKCGFPEKYMRVKVYKENVYRHPEYVITVHSAVVCIALSMRDKWKRMFEHRQRSNDLIDILQAEKYLMNIEALPEFRTDELDKIRRSLAFYSELILFLHYSNIKVDFENLLNIWSSYFEEKIAVNYDSELLLDAIFIKDCDIENYVRFVDGFIQEFANPYGKIDDVSREFLKFTADVDTFYRELLSGEAVMEDLTVSPPVEEADLSDQPPVDVEANLPDQPPVNIEANLPDQPPVDVEANLPDQPPVDVEANLPDPSPAVVEANLPDPSPPVVEANLPDPSPAVVEANLPNPSS